MYLVEEYGDVSHLKLTERALEQAITNTQAGVYSSTGADCQLLVLPSVDHQWLLCEVDKGHQGVSCLPHNPNTVPTETLFSELGE